METAVLFYNRLAFYAGHIFKWLVSIAVNFLLCRYFIRRTTPELTRANEAERNEHRC